MKPVKPTKTESTFSSNAEVKRNAGFVDWKRDGSVKDISVALYDVDYAVKWHIENIIQPTITEENTVITCPVMFAAGEKWAAIQKHGYLRDSQGKLLTPLIVIKRNSVSRREDIQDLKVLETIDARITFERQYTKQNRYDRFGLSNNKPLKEYYSVDVPKFVQVEYELLCWTNNTAQLNELVEQLIWFDGKAFGDSHKFITHIDPPAFESINNNGEDRIVRATLSMRTKAHILNTHGVNAPSMYKLNPVNKLVIGIEIDGTNEISSLKSVAGNISSSPIASNVSRGGTSGGSVSTDVVLYLSYNKQLTGVVANTTTVNFTSGWETAPSPLPATSIDNFMFFVNGAMLERSAIHSFTTSSGISTLVIDVNQLSYTLAASDEVIGIGKFINQDNLA